MASIDSSEIVYTGTYTSIPLAYYIVVLVVGIILAVAYGRLVVDPASYVIPDLPVNPVPLIALIVYELLILPWTYKYNRRYGVLRMLGIPIIAAAVLVKDLAVHITLAVIGTMILVLEAKILVELAYQTQQIVTFLAGGVKGVTALLAGIYAMALAVPGLKDSIIAITQFILALTPFIILGAWLFTVIYTLTTTREPLRFATITVPLTLLAIILAILAFIYIQPALKDPHIAMKTYGDITRTLSLTTPILVLIGQKIQAKLP